MKVEDLTREEKIGQLFQVGFPGTEPTEEVEELLTEYHVGGVIYFARNLESPGQTRALSRSLQETATAEGGPPLVISTDQEGGTVRRLPFYTPTPGAMAIGATGDPEAAKTVADVTGSGLRSVGINLNLAPVLDVNSNPENPVIGVRSFGEESEVVAEFGSRYVRALQSAGVAACGKHFPGHGDTATDSHLELPVVDGSEERLEEVELAPFRRAVKTGIDAVMTAHVAFPAITGSRSEPATLSRAVLSGCLRDRLGFDGLVVTDCMEMDAIADGVGTPRGCVEAIKAGADVVLVSHTPDRQRRSVRAVREAIADGEIPESRLDEAVERVLSLKRRRDLRPTDTEPDAEADQRAVRSVARRAVTLLRGDRVGFATDEPLTVFAAGTRRGSPAEDGRGYVGTLTDLLGERGFEIRKVVRFGEGSEEPDLEAVPEDGQMLCCTADASRDPEQVEIVSRLADPTVVAVRNPYDLRVLPEVEPLLTIYDPTPGNLAALVEILAGDRRPEGRCPPSLR